MGVFGSVGAALTLIVWSLLDLPLFRESPEGAVRWIRDRGLARQLREQQPEPGIA
jgi:hypothetical protein